MDKKASNFFMAPRAVVHHSSFSRLSATAQAAWLHFGLAYNGKNNGEIHLPCRILGDRLNVAKNTAARAIEELINAGFLAMTKASSFSGKRRAAEYRLTHLKCDKSGDAPSNVFMNTTPKVVPFKPKRCK
jgi:hypothetical protein